MNPNYAIILWILTGGLAGWVGSKVTGTDRGMFANIMFGIVGAVAGGFLAKTFIRHDPGDNGVLISFFIAILGACVMIAGWKTLRRVL